MAIQLPSRFIDELPEDHVDVLTPPGLYGGGYGAAVMAQPAQSGPDADRAAKADVYNSPGWPQKAPPIPKALTPDAATISVTAAGKRV
jgi:DNA helicase-2/ATP-dependent DNA helicase PcrA